MLCLLFVCNICCFGFRRVTAFSETIDASAPLLNGTASVRASKAYHGVGTITRISDSSITLYHGATYIITASTVCRAHSKGESMMHMRVVSCSYFAQGMTVSITAEKNTTGELVATEIRDVFF